jgi:hypothetical protein
VVARSVCTQKSSSISFLLVTLFLPGGPDHQSLPCNEDYSIRSPERSELLLKIKGILKDASVSPALWACCQLADMNRLQAITKWEEEVINSYHKSLAVIAMKCELLRF